MFWIPGLLLTNQCVCLLNWVRWLASFQKTLNQWDPDISPLFISPPLFFATHNLPLSTFCHFSFCHSHFATHSLPPTFRHPRFCHSSFCHTHFATTVFATLVLPITFCHYCYAGNAIVMLIQIASQSSASTDLKLCFQ